MVKEVIKTEAQRDSANFFLQLGVAGTILLLLMATLVCMVLFNDELNNNTNFSMWLGAVIGWGGILLNFCFPNSIGSQKQADTISKLAGQAQDKVPPVTGEAKDSVDGQIAASTGGIEDGQVVGGNGGGPTAAAYVAGSDSVAGTADVDFAPTESPAGTR